MLLELEVEGHGSKEAEKDMKEVGVLRMYE